MKKNISLYNAFINGSHEENATAILYSGKKISYTALKIKIGSLARSLISFGIKKDDVAIICLPNIPESAQLLYACNKIGAVAFFVHPLSAPAQFKEYIAKTNAKIAFCFSTVNPEFVKICSQSGTHCVSVNPANSLGKFKKFMFGLANKQTRCNEDYAVFAKRGDKELAGIFIPPEDKDPSETAVLQCSGGTGGEPKIVELSARAINSLCASGLTFLGTQSAQGKTMLSALPYFHAFGLSMGLHVILTLGACAVMIPKFRRKRVVPLFRRGKINYIIGVPSLYGALVTHPKFFGKGLRQVDIAFVGGDFTPQKLIDTFNARMRESGSLGELFEGYGLTETVAVSCVNTRAQNKTRTVGKAVDGVMVKIIDANENGLGEICLGGETLMNGYYKNEEATKNSHFTDADGNVWFKTGDCGFVDSDGYLNFKQRKKRIIKVSGASVFPVEIEEKLSGLENVKNVCAFDVSDLKASSRVAIAVASDTTDPEPLKKLIAQTIESSFPPEAHPKAVHILKELPLTKNNKIDVLELKNLFD